MAVILHLVGLVIRTSRIIHDHDESTVEGAAHSSLVERLRCVGLRRSDSFAVLVAECIGELLYRFAQRQGENVIDCSEHLCLALLDVGRLFTVSDHTAQFQSEFPKF